MISEQMKRLARVASLYTNRQKGLELLKQLEASDLNDDTRDDITRIMRQMGIIREMDVQEESASELPPRDEA